MHTKNVGGGKSYLKKPHQCVSRIQAVFQWFASADPHWHWLHWAGRGGQPRGPGPRQPRGSASADHAMFWSRCVWMWVSGLPSCLGAWSGGAAGGTCGQRVGRWPEINPRPRAGKLVLGLSQGVEAVLRNHTAQGGLPRSARQAGARSTASLAGPRASSPSATRVAVGLLLEVFFLTRLSLAVGVNCLVFFFFFSFPPIL